MFGLTIEEMTLLDAKINLPEKLSSYKQIAIMYGYKSPEKVRQIIKKAKRKLEYRMERI